MRSLLLVAGLACAVYALAEWKPEKEKDDNSALTEIDNGNDFALASNGKISSSALEAWQESLFSESEPILGRYHWWRWGKRSRGRKQRLSLSRRHPPSKCEGNECSHCLEIESVKGKEIQPCFTVAHNGENFDVTLTASGVEVFNKNIPFDHSQPLCGTADGKDICAEIYDASIENSKAHACLKVTKPIDDNVSCFNMESSIHPITQEVTNYITEDTDSGNHGDLDDNDEDGDDRLMEFEAIE